MQWFHTVIEYALVTVLPFWATWRILDLVVDCVKKRFSKRADKTADGEFRIVGEEENQYDEQTCRTIQSRVERYKID